MATASGTPTKLFSDTLYSGAADVGGEAFAKAINAPGLAKARADDPDFGAPSSGNWRARAKAGEDIGPDIQSTAAQLPPGHPALPGLSAFLGTQRSDQPSLARLLKVQTGRRSQFHAW